MQIGLLFGSFNPIHTGHLIIANTVLNELPLTKIWFIVSPQNPLKKSGDLLNAAIRLQLVKKAIADNERMVASDVEFNLPSPSYTTNTLNYLETAYTENEFYFILGSDSFQQLNKWKDYETIMQKNLIVYQRPGFVMSEKNPANITIVKSPLLEISATQIRTLIKTNKSIRYLVPDVVREEIEKNNYYR